MKEREYICKNCRKIRQKQIKVGKVVQTVFQCSIFPRVYHPTGLIRACVHYQSKLDV